MRSFFAKTTLLFFSCVFFSAEILALPATFGDALLSREVSLQGLGTMGGILGGVR